MRKQKGFTLVELLVVIAIIGILAGALLVAINPQSMIMKSNDAKRLSDIDSLTKAINLALTEQEIALGVTGTCADCTSDTGDRDLDGLGWVKYTIPTGKVGLSRFVAVLPIDPVNDTVNTVAHVYTFGSSATDFEVNVVLQHEDNLLKMSTDGGNNPNAYESGTSLLILP
ncbi:hypothetical protein A2380_01865 [candidate division WWE3 bacterium RIFOXYB1_FULL_43_24]|uniref:General secretion pathway protein H n=2 Tax=Katanobacteria TaxID=422282 RepID=A0A0G0YPV1_UNCKA|nr:MAG: General secretion pathway protein H [candidate division WWE3 bacterium GW2011_GWA1_42_12]KKS34933.1 MAG: General secretion pathway protein H [candidate division WWE3 bacterium GW2011_GWD1_42_14]KKS38634.1 MAG: General secretion pathway protein H [candidate division WWE3 bacterium GW2011_GWF1_42_14]KKS40413.1 MAG: General secretion pathway protein H [candidate division WWE3 bacterium GW2011_GWE1_42_16]KKS66616.1 MAG: General secretion pathway protein H [candidate division WWE3 bacterium 